MRVLYIFLQKCFQTISKLPLRPVASEERQNTQYFPQKVTTITSDSPGIFTIDTASPQTWHWYKFPSENLGFPYHYEFTYVPYSYFIHLPSTFMKASLNQSLLSPPLSLSLSFSRCGITSGVVRTSRNNSIK